MSNIRHEVKPQPHTAVPVTDEEREQAAKASREQFGCGALVLVGIVDVVGFYFIGFLPTILATSALLATYYFYARGGEMSRLASQRIQAEQQSIESEARSLTTALTTIHDSAPNHLESLKGYMKSADSELDMAERDFQDSAFAPFWDAIERAANCLSSFDQTTRQLTGQAKQYYSSLRDRDHTFPTFPVGLTALPDPTHTTNRLQAIVRKAQCNFQFAMIYEQRKTNNILKHGFMSLSSAISDLGSEVCNSIHELRDSVSSGFATLSEQQIATRESIESAVAEIRTGNEAAEKAAREQQGRDQASAEMLDNIQRRRKPWPPKSGDGEY